MITYEPGGETFNGLQASIGDRVLGYIVDGVSHPARRVVWRPECAYVCTYRGKWTPDQATAKLRLEKHLNQVHDVISL